MATKIQVKRGTSANFTSQSLSAGEPAFLTDTGKLYLGDGAKKVLINPVDKPDGISTTAAYTKVRVNEYGQVVAQSNLTAQDIPSISSAQVTGFGTAAAANIGTASGQIPTLDSAGKFPTAVMPAITPPGINNICASYTGIDVSIGVNQVIPLNEQNSAGTGLALNANGGISVSVSGTYLLTYNVSSASALLKVGLSSSTGTPAYWPGSMSIGSSAALTPFISVSATIIRALTSGENIYIKNIGTLAAIYIGSACSLCAVRIA